MIIKQLSVFLENKSGRLTEVTRILNEENVNISAFSIADTADYGILRMIVSNPDKAEKALKGKSFSVHITEVVCLVVPHEPGGLYRALEILSKSNISIEYMYAFAQNDSASVIIRSNPINETIRVLQDHKMELVAASDIYDL